DALKEYAPSSVSTQIQPVFVDTMEAFDALSSPLSQAELVGLDTEFIRETTFNPQLALLQIALPKHDCQYLLDVLALPDLGVCDEVMLSPGVMKVLHGCSEDLEIFFLRYGQVPSPIFDTQVAVALLGSRIQMGYDALVSGLLGSNVDKSETRSDWLKRPLSTQQLHYAATDVRYLLPLYEVLNQALLDRGRREWLDDEMAQLSYGFMNPSDPARLYQRVNQHWRLRGKALYVLQQLCIWRENQVRTRNIPRNFLVSDAALWAIAQEGVSTKIELKSIAALKPIQYRKYGDAILEAMSDMLANATEEAGNALPVRLPQPKKYRDIGKRIKRIVQARAAVLAIDPSLLLGKRLMMSFLRKTEKQYRRLGKVDLSQLSGQPWLHGWRQQAILSHLVEVVELWLANKQDD
ncbi:MAG: ribonuclease D, partial [Gammaproteobacteria bacterium]